MDVIFREISFRVSVLSQSGTESTIICFQSHHAALELHTPHHSSSYNMPPLLIFITSHWLMHVVIWYQGWKKGYSVTAVIHNNSHESLWSPPTMCSPLECWFLRLCAHCQWGKTTTLVTICQALVDHLFDWLVSLSDQKVILWEEGKGASYV